MAPKKFVEIKTKLGGISHGEIHRRTGLSLSHVNRVMNGNRRPSTRTIERIATAVGIAAEDLFAYLCSRQISKSAA